MRKFALLIVGLAIFAAGCVVQTPDATIVVPPIKNTALISTDLISAQCQIDVRAQGPIGDSLVNGTNLRIEAASSGAFVNPNAEIHTAVQDYLRSVADQWPNVTSCPAAEPYVPDTSPAPSVPKAPQ